VGQKQKDGPGTGIFNGPGYVACAQVYMYTEASDEHDAVAAGLAMKDHVDSDEEGIEVEEEVWIGNGEGPGPGACTVCLPCV